MKIQLQHSLLRYAHHAVSRDHKVIDDFHFDERQRLFQCVGERQIRRAWFRDPQGMVVGKDDGGGIYGKTSLILGGRHEPQLMRHEPARTAMSRSAAQLNTLHPHFANGVIRMNRATNKISRDRLIRGIGVALLGLAFAAIVTSAFPHQAHLLVLLIAVSLVYWGVHGLAHYSRAEKWLPVKAIICSIREDWIDVSLRYTKLRYVFPRIEYEYCLNGNTFKSNTVSFDVENIWVPEIDVWGLKVKEQEKFWLGWKQGQSMIVFVNGEKPTESVIINKISKKQKSQNMAFIMGGALIGILWLCIFIWQ